MADDAVSRSRMPKGVLLSAIFFGGMVLACLVQACFMDRDTFAYDVSMLRAIVFMAVNARCLWLVHTRSEHGRGFIMGGMAVLAVLTLVDIAVGGAYPEIRVRVGDLGVRALLTIEIVGFFSVLAYMAVSNKARAYFSVPFDPTPAFKGGHSWDKPLKERIRTWEFWRDTAIYFIVFSILGHWAEILFCRLILLGVFQGGYDPTNAMLWDQWLFPFSAEGIALAMVVLLLHPVKEMLLKRFNGRVLPALVCSFLINAFICTSIDFLTGMAVNQNYELWDYRDMPFNFMGQVCLQNSMVYSIAATFIVWWLYPVMDSWLRRLPKQVADGLFFVLLGMYAFLACLYFVVIPK